MAQQERGVDRAVATSGINRPKRRTFLKTMGVGALAATAGCLGGDDDGEVGDTIRVGVLAPLPGQFPGGTAIANASELWGQQVNDDGGLLGADVEVLVRNTELDPSRAQTEYRELVLEEDVDATFGAFTGEVGLALIDEIAQQQIPHIAAGVAVTDMNRMINDDYDTYKYWFRAMPNGEMLGSNLATYVSESYEEMGWNTVGLAIEDVEGFQPIVESLEDNLPGGIDLAFDTVFAPDTDDFTPILDRGDSEDIDGLLAFLSQGGLSLLTQWADREPSFGLGGADINSTNPDHYANTDGAAESVWTYIPGAAPNAAPTQTTLDFVEAHEDEFGAQPPHSQGYTAYDAVLAYQYAVEAAESVDPDEVVAELEELEFEGATGNMEFYDADHEWAHDPVYGEGKVVPPMIQWQDGEQVGLWPDNVAEGEFQHPPWF
ncbi:ABC transporter substrate-binding protein [Halobacteria archaeon AArc-curdl1]|uniref:ABC transporter substrate-binding protein n=1 Tax=Natronosalvus hydrolyticus TaxID=2979988 RepID=A0AAP3E8B4_9EURY|nr:ABC transporter substrate-binding protein [Halobacteria archaeon AArc-curdl1]